VIRVGREFLVPTLRVGTHGLDAPRLSSPSTADGKNDAERRTFRSHAERGNETLFSRAIADHAEHGLAAVERRGFGANNQDVRERGELRAAFAPAQDGRRIIQHGLAESGRDNHKYAFLFTTTYWLPSTCNYFQENV